MNLVSFGCSWTWGVGLKYYKGMPRDEYENTKKDLDCAETYSFRALLAKKYNLSPTKNFSVGASSNQRQFRHAEWYFTPKKDLSNTIILWGITSTARYEVWRPYRNDYKSVMLTRPYSPEELRRDPVARWVINERDHFYDHDQEVQCLYKKMCHWNEYFALKGAKVVWFDTLNHHNYKRPVDNMFGAYDKPRDLLSKLAEHKDKDQYHFSMSSAWEDCNRISKLKKKGIVNPHSGHPTKEGHEILCDMLSPSIERCL